MTDTFDSNGEYNSYNNDDDNDNNYGNKRKIASGNSNLGSHNGDNPNHGGGGGNVGLVAGGNLSGANVGGGGGGSLLGSSSTSGAGVVLNNSNSGEHGIQLNEKAAEYIRDCFAEKNRMERKFPIAEKLLDSEIEKVQTTGRIPSREQKYADIYREKPLRISQKVLVPIREHPKFNFVGKLLGPKGNSLRRLQEETFCKMTVLGRNSMRDRIKEEELRASKDPKYSHLNYDLHVEISTVAPPAEAYARIAYAMAELRKYLIPDNNDIIRQEQLRELMDHGGNNGSSSNEANKNSFKKINQMGGSIIGGNNMSGITSGMAGMGLGGNPNAGALSKQSSHVAGSSGSMGGMTSTYRGPNQTNSFNKNSALPPKQKVMSILEKARTAMDETYGRGYDDVLSYDQHTYDYAYSQATHSSANTPHGNQNLSGLNAGSRPSGAGGPYETNDYDPEYNRRDYYRNPNIHNVTGGVAMNPNQNRNHINR